MSNEQKRRSVANIRTFFICILFTTIFVLWATELYQFILSIAALCAAMAIATKDLVLNFGGTFYRAFAHPFSVGDRIEVNEIRGDVVDIGLMSTQLLEVGPKDYTHQFTGRTISIPNSLFLSHNIYNETDSVSKEDEYALHVFKVPIKNDPDWKKHVDTILEAANKACKQFEAPAEIHFQKMARKRQVDMPWIEPRINLKFSSSEEIFLIVRVSVPVRKKGTIEQEIIKEYLSTIF